jgi:DNA polymerase-3 subunit gamma/tau
MSYLVLARKYRPADFEAFVGQDVIAQTLGNAIEMGRVAHAYLFCGPRGVGKTSMARVFAKALNCVKGPIAQPCNKCERCESISSGQDVDVIEIDGASNRGIGEVRDIRQNARYAASHSRFKIYYIDEVHMLTTEAFNALLKTLEEPPPHVKFIFATTSASKLPDTILSRVQRYDFKRITNADIIRKLKEISKAEKLRVPEDVLALIARRGRGSMRDSLSLTDQILSFCGDKPTLEQVTRLLGALGDEEMGRILGMMRAKDAAGLLKTADELLARGMDVGELVQQLTQYLRDLLVARICGASPDLLDRSEEGAKALAETAREYAPEHLLYIAETLNTARRRVREGQDERVVLEMLLVKLARAEALTPVTELIERLAAFEEILVASAGQAPSAAAPAAPPRGEPARARAAAPPPPPPQQQPMRVAEPAPPQDAAYAEEPPEGQDSIDLPTGPAPTDPGEVWQRLLAAAHKKSSMLYMNLFQGRLQRLDATQAVVAFPASRGNARKDVEAQRDAVRGLLTGIIQRPVELVFVTVQEGSAPPKSSAPGAAPVSTDSEINKWSGRFGAQMVSN